MRIRLATALAACIFIGAFPAAPVSTDGNQYVGDHFFDILEKMIPARVQEPYWDTFQIDAAIWNNIDRVLLVKARTNREKGTFLSLTGLPASTWVDAIRFSADHSVEYFLPVAEGRAAPCQVVVRSAFESITISVMHAPPACSNPFRIAGTITTEAGVSMPKGTVTVTVGETEFTTIANEYGNYALDVYSDSPDEFVTITAQGEIGGEQMVLRIYAGSISRLDGDDSLRT